MTVAPPARAARRAAVLGVAGALTAAVVVISGTTGSIPRAEAQRLDPRSEAVFVVGAPGGASPMMRVDAHRTGCTKAPLPRGPIHVAWRKTLGLTVEHPALAGPDGTLSVVTARGDVVFLNEAGEELGRTTTGATATGPAAVTSDGTVVFMSSAGDVVGARRPGPRPRFVTRLGGERNARAAPLPMADGGIAFATSRDLVVLDARGQVRARASLPEPAFAPLLASGDKILAIGPNGVVYGWAPGREPSRVGSFDAPIEGGAVLAGPSTLLAVVDGRDLVELDLARGIKSTRATASPGLYLGPPTIRPTASGPSTTLLALLPTRTFVTTIDAAGQEIARASIATTAPPTLPDGGAMPLVVPPHTAPLVDARGAVAFVTPEGHVGVVGADGAVDVGGELICSKGSRSSGVAGLTPLGAGAFVVTCEAGVIVKVEGPIGNASAVAPGVPDSGTSPLLREPRDR